MPIELKYSASPGVLALAGYAAGQNKYRNRREDEWLRLAQQQQAMRFQAGMEQQRELYGWNRQQAAFGQQRELQGQQLAAIDQRQALADQRAQERANAEARARGEIEPFPNLPQIGTGGGFAQGTLNPRTGQFEFGGDTTSIAGQAGAQGPAIDQGALDRQDRLQGFGLLPAPDNVPVSELDDLRTQQASQDIEIDKTTQRQLQQIEANRAGLASKPLSDEGRARAYAELDKLELRIRQHATVKKVPTAFDIANKGMLYFNPKTQRYQKEPEPGVTVPHHVGPTGNPEPIIDKGAEAEERAKKQQEDKSQRDENARLTRELNMQKARTSYRATLMKMTKEDPKTTSKVPALTPEEIEAEVEKAFPTGAQGGTSAPAPAATGPVQITTDEEWNKLPSGTEFIGPDGKRYRKN